jgi:hypothetical protein
MTFSIAICCFVLVVSPMIVKADSSRAAPPPITLVCNLTPTNNFGGNQISGENDTFVIDMAKRTVNNKPATIDDTGISWVENAGQSGTIKYKKVYIINRVTSHIDAYYSEDSTVPIYTSLPFQTWAGTCTKAQRAF